MANYELVAGDGGSTLHLTVLDSVTRAPVDLTGKTVQLRYRLNGGTIVLKNMTALNQTTNPGEATYLFAVADLPSAGTMDAEIRLQAGLTDQLTSVDTFHLAIKAPLA